MLEAWQDPAGKGGLDFARAGEVFDGVSVTMQDRRQEYGEPRFISVGLLWTPRDWARRIISMRKANEREIARYLPDLERSR